MFPFSQAEWDQTPSAVQAHLVALDTTVTTLDAQLQQQVDQLQGRLDQTLSTSSKPPSSDSPFKPRKPHQSSGQWGEKTGHRSSGLKLLEPTDVEVVLPPFCSCGHSAVSAPTPYCTHQVLELPPIEMEVTHFILHQATWLGCGRTLSAEVPPAHASGYGPRLGALIGRWRGYRGHRGDCFKTCVTPFCPSRLACGRFRRSLVGPRKPWCRIMR